MADTKVSALTAATVAAVANEIPVNEAGGSKKITLAQVQDLLGIQKVRLGTQHDNSTVTPTAVSGLAVAMVAGTYTFKYHVIYQSAALTTGIRLNVNYTGTKGAFVYQWRWVDVSATASTAVPTQAGVIAAGQVQGAFSSRTAFTTGAGGVTLSVDAINSDMLAIIEGTIVTTGSGNLEIWHGSEVAFISSVMVGSSGVVTRVA